MISAQVGIGRSTMMQMLQAIRGQLDKFVRRSQPIRTAEGFRAFLEAEAAHVSQSAVYDYLRARAGRFAPQLFREEPFLAALERTRWEAFPAVLADLSVIALGELRREGGDPAILAHRLTELYRATLARYPAPPHRADGWHGCDTALADRLVASAVTPARAPDAVAGHSGAIIFEALPLHPDIRRLDEEMVVNNVRFRVLRSWETLKARVDLRGLAADLASVEATAR